MEWFDKTSRDRWGSIRCSDILGEDQPGEPDKSHCRQMLALSWVRLPGILTMHNIAYGKGKQDSPERYCLFWGYLRYLGAYATFPAKMP